MNVPVVAVTPNTRTVPNCDCSFDCLQMNPGCNGIDGERTVPTVTWLVVDQPADLEVPCPDCDDGVATWQEGDATCIGLCWTCDGTGRVVRVYAAETEWRFRSDAWTTKSVVNPGGPQCEWRQVVRWQATTVKAWHIDSVESLLRFSYVSNGEPLTLAPSLKDGDVVLRLDGWEPVNPPITTMRCADCQAVDPERESVVIGCPEWLPLSVPSGTIARIEVP